ncbi:AfsR/SARP family transcriptional regulator [Rugosimonospora africana]|uniref:OmpR/PhoB-type domain-containing protein n=1 Tax=Rugosimonospora africana TaxID=556532 RepID=A0A8J3QUH5_9ACTN|nr:BTAD domain-containing putative transcriptional regulator [Rugosimonospora africana]GIH17715.1 hypothetical protein Raf01_58870 [Rugosimonospora africana]
MELRLFGEVQLRAAGRPLEVGTPRQRAVLAALAVDAPRPVSVDALVHRLWGEAAPAEARNVVYSHLSRVRRLLATVVHSDGAVHSDGTVPARITRRPAGYVLDIEPDRVDLCRFRRLAGHGQAATLTDDERAGVLREALGLWRGAPLEGLSGEWVEQVRASLSQQRLELTIRWAATELRLGRFGAVTAALPELIDEYPLVEPLESLLMRALHADGRQAEAIDRYAAVRRRLADELGTDPGEDLRELHQALLRGQLPRPRPAEPAPAAPVAAPRAPSRPTTIKPATIKPATIKPAAIEPTAGEPATIEPTADEATAIELAAIELAAGEPVRSTTGEAAPIHQAPTHQAPAQQAPTHQTPNNQTRNHDAPTHRAPTHPAPTHPMPTHDAPTHPMPAQLPPELAGFTGRGAELRRLDDLLADASTGGAAILAIDGTTGIGKTVLAVHWAHRIAARFPDGQLYVNLRGFDPTATPVAPSEAVRGFLDALGVPPQRMPLDLETQAGRYRSLLSGRRVLVLLDNARDAEQVRPLLPGAPGCLVVVTTRQQPTGLVIAEGARPLTLGLMSPAEARELLARRIGADRVAAEPVSVDEIVASCAGLPLALAIVAARAAVHPQFSLAALAGELRQARGGLDAFAGEGDRATDARAAFSWSYRQLRPGTARLFRLMGLHPGPDIAARAAASLAGTSPGQARRDLAELAAAHLVAEHVPGRYARHDLLRAYASELAATHDPQPDRQAALRRILDCYLHTAHRAAALLNQHRHPIALTAAAPSVSLDELTSARQASAWLETEYANLLAGIRLAATAGLSTHAWQLAWTLTTFFDRRGRWHDWVAAQRTALDAVRGHCDVLGQAHAHRGLALAYFRLGRHDDARDHDEQALALFGDLDDQVGRAHTHLHLAWVHERYGDHQRALEHARQSLALHRTTGDRPGQANALNALGWFHTRRGDHQSALAYCQQALELFRSLDNRIGQAATWDSLGLARHHLGQHAQSDTCYQRALELFREAADRYNEARTLINLGESYQAANSPEAADQTWRQALDILEQLGHPDAAELRDRLHAPAP